MPGAADARTAFDDGETYRAQCQARSASRIDRSPEPHRHGVGDTEIEITAERGGPTLGRGQSEVTRGTSKPLTRPSSCTWARRRYAHTSPGSWPSSTSATECRRSSWPTRSAWYSLAHNRPPAAVEIATPPVHRPGRSSPAASAAPLKLSVNSCASSWDRTPRSPVAKDFCPTGATFRPCPRSRAHRAPPPPRETPVGRLPRRGAQVPPRTPADERLLSLVEASAVPRTRVELPFTTTRLAELANRCCSRRSDRSGGNGGHAAQARQVSGRPPL
jgi:hypothetical protein